MGSQRKKSLLKPFFLHLIFDIYLLKKNYKTILASPSSFLYQGFSGLLDIRNSAVGLRVLIDVSNTYTVEQASCK